MFRIIALAFFLATEAYAQVPITVPPLMNLSAWKFEVVNNCTTQAGVRYAHTRYRFDQQEVVHFYTSGDLFFEIRYHPTMPMGQVFYLRGERGWTGFENSSIETLLPGSPLMTMLDQTMSNYANMTPAQLKVDLKTCK